MERIFQSFLMLVMGFIFQYALMERRYSRKKTLFILLGSLLAVFILNAAFFVSTNYLLFVRLYPLTIHLPVFLLFMSLSKYRDFRLLFNLLTAVFLCNFISLIGSLVSLALRSSMTASIISRLAVFVPILIFVIKIFCPLYLQLLDKLRKGWTLFCLIPALSYAMNYLLGYYPAASTERAANILPLILSNAIAIAAYGVIFIFLRQIQQQFTIQNEQQILKLQVSALVNQLDTVREAEKKASILHHDMRHYIQNIACILKNDGEVAAMEFLGKFDDLFEQKTASRYCENQTLNAILNYYLENAKKLGITVKTHLEITEEISVDAIELSAVIANAIENAIHACCKLSEGSDKSIELVCISKPHFVFEITNTYSGEVLFDSIGLPLSREEGHGIGTRSIDAFVKKNNAILDYKTENGLFRLRILLN